MFSTDNTSNAEVIGSCDIFHDIRYFIHYYSIHKTYFSINQRPIVSKLGFYIAVPDTGNRPGKFKGFKQKSIIQISNILEVSTNV